MKAENVKVGDKVRCLVSEFDVVAGNLYTVIETDLNAVYVIDDADDKWRLSSYKWEPQGYGLSPNDIVRLKSGAAFTTGSLAAVVDSVSDDKVILTHGSWVPAGDVKKVEKHQFKVGDYVRVLDNSTPAGFSKPVLVGAVAKITQKAFAGWMLEGSGSYFYTDAQLEPASPPDATVAEPQFKAGDTVRAVRASFCNDATGRHGTIERVDGYGAVLVNFSDSDIWWQRTEDIELVSATSPTAEPDHDLAKWRTAFDEWQDSCRRAVGPTTDTPDTTDTDDDFVSFTISGNHNAVVKLISALS